MTPISPQDWKRIEPLFDKVLDLPEQERESYLTDTCGDDPKTAAQIRQLLKAHEDSPDDFGVPIAKITNTVLAGAIHDPLLDQEIGPFKMIREIGRGGMGVVYLAKRIDGSYEQDVVVKVLRLGSDSEDSRRRFLQERQILASLVHPAIVGLIDGGLTPDGRPYIVMNKVTGQPINHYCQEQKLDVKDSIRLFLAVIDAVDYAHKHLVVHRDIKPSNVWVDVDGKVQLFDFGIAKIMDEDQPGMTMTGQRLMTPEYASPEQVRQEGITTASDVYQLGLLLYRILTNRLPFELEDQSVRNIEKIICDTEPLPPSQVADGSLKKSLKGDLDLILLKALRKEPGRRYQFAGELRDDLVRYLSGEGILARRSSWGYMVKRFWNNHRWALSMVGILMVASLGFGLFHMDRITRERDVARQEADQRREVSDFLVNMLQIPDPTRAGGREITARELLTDAFTRIDHDLTDPLTIIRMLKVVGEVSSNLGLYDQARPALARVVDLTTGIYGPRSPEAADAELMLAELLRSARKFEAAAVSADNALSIRKELFPADSVEVGQSLVAVGLSRRDLRENEKAEKYLREALAIYEKHYSGDDPRLPAVRADLAFALRAGKKYEESEQLYRGAISQMRQSSDYNQESMAGALNNLAYLLKLKKEYAEAEALYKEAITRFESVVGTSHPTTLMFRNNLAGVLDKLGKDDETIDELKTIIDLQIHLHGDDHWRAGIAHRSLGWFLLTRDRSDEAQIPLQSAINNLEASLGRDHLWTARTRLHMAVAMYRSGDRVEAGKLLDEIAVILTSEAGAGDRSVQKALARLVDLCGKLNEPELRVRIEAMQAK